MIKNFIILFFKNIRKNKKIFFSSIFLFLSLIILITTLSLAYSFKKYIDNDNENNIRHRSFMVNIPMEMNYADFTKKLIEIDGVNQVVSSYGYSWNGFVEEFINENYDGTIRLYGVIKENLPEIVDGTLSKYDNNDNSTINIVCPQKLIPDSLIVWDKNWKMKPVVNTTEYFEKKLTLLHEDTRFNTKIIATYDNKLNNADNFHCFTTPDNLIKIYNMNEKDIVNNGYLIVIVDNYNNIGKVLNEFNALGLVYNVVQGTSDDIVSFVVKIGISVSFIMTIFSALTIYFTYKKMIKSRNAELYTYRMLGYSYNQIKLVLLIENFIVNSIVLLLSIFISLIILRFFDFYFQNSTIGNSNIGIYFNYFSFVYAFVFSFVVPFLVILLSFGNSNVSIIAEVRKEN